MMTDVFGADGKLIVKGNEEGGTADLAALQALQEDVDAVEQTLSDLETSGGATTAVYEGVTVDAREPWEDGLIMADEQVRALETGLNLLEDVDHIQVSFARNVDATGGDLWPCPQRQIRIKDIAQDITQGMLISHFDNQFLAVTTTTEAELMAGRINFQAQSQSDVFGYEITRVEFRKHVGGSQPLVGFKFEGPPNLEGQIKGLAAIYERTIANGATDNPIFASRWPSLVSGSDLVFPATLEGAFSRNLGGNAAAFETFQNHAQARNPNNPIGTQVNSGGGNTVRSIDTSASETRPANYAMQWYFIMDDYVDPTTVGVSGSALNNATANMTTQNSAPSAGTDLVMDIFRSLSGGVTINDTNSEFTLPQSDTLYSLKAILGFDFDGSPVGAWEVEWFSDGDVIADSQEAQFRAFSAGGHSQPEYFNPIATAIVDASAGPVVVSLRVTTGGTAGVDITRAYVEIDQKPKSAILPTPVQTAAVEFLSDLGWRKKGGAITESGNSLSLDTAAGSYERMTPAGQIETNSFPAVVGFEFDVYDVNGRVLAGLNGDDLSAPQTAINQLWGYSLNGTLTSFQDKNTDVNDGGTYRVFRNPADPTQRAVLLPQFIEGSVTTAVYFRDVRGLIIPAALDGWDQVARVFVDEDAVNITYTENFMTKFVDA